MTDSPIPAAPKLDGDAAAMTVPLRSLAWPSACAACGAAAETRASISGRSAIGGRFLAGWAAVFLLVLLGYNVLALPSAGMGFAILAEADITGQKLFMALIAYPLTVYPASLLRRFLGRRFGPRGAGVGLVALVPAWLFFFLLCVSQPQDIGPEELSALIGLLVFGAFAVENLIRVQLYVPVCGACAKTPMTKVKVLDYHPIRREVHLNLPGESARRAFSEANLGAQPV